MEKISREKILDTLARKGGVFLTDHQAEVSDFTVMEMQHRVIESLFNRVVELGDEVKRLDADLKRFYRETQRLNIRVYREKEVLNLERIPNE